MGIGWWEGEKNILILMFYLFFVLVDVGGNMGLFFGCSLLMLCEFVDFMIIMCFCCW